MTQIKHIFSPRILSTALLAACLIVTQPAVAAEEFTYTQEAFDAWLAKTKKAAIAQGISKKTVDDALEGIEPIKKIVALDRKQPEGKMTHAEYLEKVISQRRIDKGRKLYAENSEVLEAIAEKYGVQARYIVALWGVETDYGGYTGNFYVPEALATLAFEGRRESFFTKELMHSLKILDEGHITKENFKGSWAGAMGQTQFMPSSFVAYAQDYDGDEHKDIWQTRVDAFASIANYLSKSGWDDNKTWGREVMLPKDFDAKNASKKVRKPLSEWSKLGVKRINGMALPVADYSSYIVRPNGADGRAYVVYSNFDVILKWNRSDYFATAVGTLSDALNR